MLGNLPLDIDIDGFGSTKFWSRYNTTSDAVQWYGDWSSIGDTIGRYVRARDRLLHYDASGETRTALTQHLYRAGITNMTYIDDDAEKVRLLRTTNAEGMPGVAFEQQCVTKLHYESGSINSMLDRGKLDKMMNSTDDSGAIEQMFAEIDRLLAAFGRYVVVSLGTQRVCRRWLDFYGTRPYLLRVVEIPMLHHETSKHPIYLLTATKIPPPTRFEFFDYVAHKISGRDELLQTLWSSQTHMKQRYMIQYGLLTSHQQVDVYRFGDSPTSTETKPVYVMYLVDDQSLLPHKVPRTFGAMLVRKENRHQYLYSTTPGRDDIRRQSKQERLLICVCNDDDVDYTSVDIPSTIHKIVYQMAPVFVQKNFANNIPYLESQLEQDESLRQGKALRTVTSRMNGEIAVVDVGDRRLMCFANNASTIQSEGLLVKTLSTHQRKRAKAKGERVGHSSPVDHAFLACHHHARMVASVGEEQSSSGSVLVLGAGCGLLSMFIRTQYPNWRVTSVEIDASIVDIGRHQFGMNDVDDDMHEVVVGDALVFTRDARIRGAKYSRIFVDVASSRHTASIVAPLPAFLENEFLDDCRQCLAPDGLLAINMLARYDPVLESMTHHIDQHFDHCVLLHVPDDINEIIFCAMRSPTSPVRAASALKSSMIASTSALIARYSWDSTLALADDDVLILQAHEDEKRPLFDIHAMDVEMRRAPTEHMIVTLPKEHIFPLRLPL